MDICFEKPVLNQEKGVYVSKMRLSTSGKPIRLRIREARIYAVHSVRNKEQEGPMVLQVVLSPGDPEQALLEQIDQQALEKVLQENNAWFRNSLSTEAIRAFFRPSITDSNLSVLVSEQKEPLEITMDGQDYSSFRALMREGILNKRCSLELEAHGIFFYPNRCGIRWVLRCIGVMNHLPDSEEEMLANVDREEIEASWRDMVEETVGAIHSTIEELKATEARIGCILGEAIERPAADRTWNQLLEQLRVEITRWKQIKNI